MSARYPPHLLPLYSLCVCNPVRVRCPMLCVCACPVLSCRLLLIKPYFLLQVSPPSHPFIHPPWQNELAIMRTQRRKGAESCPAGSTQAASNWLFSPLLIRLIIWTCSSWTLLIKHLIFEMAVLNLFVGLCMFLGEDTSLRAVIITGINENQEIK